MNEEEKMKTTHYIVWNDNRKEGVIFDNKSDARYAARHRSGGVIESTLADDFREMYEEGKRAIQPIEITND